MKRISSSLIAVALIAGMVGCGGEGLCKLTISSTTGGSVTAPGVGTFTYAKGTVVNLIAEPNRGYRFDKWTGDVGTIANVNSASTIIVMDYHCSVTANFVPGIWDWYDLDAIRNNLNGNFILMNDLDSTTPGYEALASPTANDGKGWQPIGSYDSIYTLFTGTFDGQGHEITDLFINRPDEDDVGLFGCTWTGSVIKDVGVVDITVTGNVSVGGLVGFSHEGTVSNSYSLGSVIGGWHVGGLVGWSSANVSDSYSGTDVIGAEECVGGLIGCNAGIVSNSYSTGDVTTIKYRGGGLVGCNDGAVTNSYSSSSVTGAGMVGGLVGVNQYGTVSSSHATGSVIGNDYVGGLIGCNAGIVSTSYSIGSVTGSGYVGGLIGYNYGAVDSSFWDTQTSGQSASAGGTGQTTAEMQDIATFLAAMWDIVAVANPDVRNALYIWNIVNGVTYPFLSWQPVS